MRPQGRFIAVVGPSGVGKDSVMTGLRAARPDLRLARRVITRPVDAGGEDHVAETEDGFARRETAGEFVLSWGAHGLFYGIPVQVRDDLAAGHDVMANLSRGALAQAAERLAPVVILSLSARPETLAARLAGRGRESAADIRDRLARAAAGMPAGMPVIGLANDGPIGETVAAALAALYPASA
jgi:ribose 1,5-bisphosphokinase